MTPQDRRTIRPARWDDRPEILRLLVQMGGHEHILEHPDPLRILGEVLTQPEARAFVAEREGTIVGYAELHGRASSADGRREAWLGVLSVAPEARRRGIGAALIAAAEREAAFLGCSALVLESAQWRADAHAFYRAQGFAEKPPARRFVRAIPEAHGSLEERFLAAAARAASAVKAAIAGLDRSDPVGIGADGAPTEAADKAAEDAALEVLLRLGVPVVSEEAGLVGAQRVEPGQPWISLDPLDGSRNFLAGYPAYAISIALVVSGRSRAGMVVDLDGGHRWWGVAGGGAWRNGRPVRACGTGLLAFPSPLGDDPSPPQGRGETRIRVSGSTALDLCRVADGGLAAFASLGRPVVRVHDAAAGFCLIEEAGGTILDRTERVPELVPDPRAPLFFVASAERGFAQRLLDERFHASGSR